MELGFLSKHIQLQQMVDKRFKCDRGVGTAISTLSLYLEIYEVNFTLTQFFGRAVLKSSNFIAVSMNNYVKESVLLLSDPVLRFLRTFLCITCVT